MARGPMLGGEAGWHLPRRPPSPWRSTAETLLVLVLLPLLGALVAYRLTSALGPGPLGFVLVAEAPPAEVAGARAVEDQSGLGMPGALRVPAGVTQGDPALQGRTSLASLAELGGSFETSDGVLIRVPVGAVRGAWPSAVAGVALTGPPGVLGIYAPGAATRVGAARASDAGSVLGITEEIDPAPAAGGADSGVGGRTDGGASGATILSGGELLYRPLSPGATPGPTDRPSPNVLRLFAMGAVAPDGVPLARFTAPLTLTVPYAPETVNGWVALAAYDPSSGGWTELPVRAVSVQRGTVSAQLPQPAVVALLENRPPVAVEDLAETEMDVPVAVDVLANDSDPDGDALGVFDRATTSAAGGEVRCAQSGACVYTPPVGFSGEDSFAYGLGDLRTKAWSDYTATGVVTVIVRTPQS